MKLPQPWNTRNDDYLAYSEQVGLQRLVSFIFSLPFFLIGLFLLLLVPFRLIPKVWQSPAEWSQHWWAVPVVLVLMLGGGALFSFAGLHGMFYCEGVVFDRGTKTCTLWWRFLWRGADTHFLLAGYDTVHCERSTQSGVFGSARFTLRITGLDRPAIAIDTVRETYGPARQKAAEVASFLDFKLVD